jgi:16S rRNA (adenine1518-N6/adenine1519-N6)-dimethyltransferase
MTTVAERPAQPSLRRMREFGVRPDRELGQNFLVDSNILGVIDRAAALAREDVILEVGGGLGVLTEHLAARAGHVHVIEIDERLREALSDATDPLENVTVHWGDAMRLDLTALRPAPAKVVANLPYGIAAGFLLRTVHELAGLRCWVAMVQREVGERLAAASGTAAYGAPSVLAQLECEVEVMRTISRTVFHPVPNVDSALVRMVRLPPPEPGSRTPGEEVAVRELVAGAFAHRRKTLAGSLVLAGAGRARTRAEVRSALQELGLAPDVRAERLGPADFRALARLLAR